MNVLENYNVTVRRRDSQIQLDLVETGEPTPAG